MPITMALNLMKLLFITFLTITLCIANTQSSTFPNVDEDDNDKLPFRDSKEPFWLQGSGRGRFLAGRMTCDRYPTVCRAKGSAGPDCCGKQCVDTNWDKLNCGKCGKKCKYSELCCGGTCVNPSKDENNCGRCNKRCSKGSSCGYGMCSYA